MCIRDRNDGDLDQRVSTVNDVGSALYFEKPACAFCELVHHYASRARADKGSVVESDAGQREKNLKSLTVFRDYVYAHNSGMILLFVPFRRDCLLYTSQVPLVLAGADVLLATLESDAGQFAVPSKVLSYLCAGRPLLLAAPKINLAAEIVERSSSGFVADPDRPEEFVGAAKRLAADAGLRCSLAANARRYAEREFEISRLAARFEEILLKASPSIRSAVVSRAPFAEPPLSVAAMVPGIQTSQELSLIHI